MIGRLAAAVLGEPVDDRALRVGRAHPGELARVHHDLVLGVLDERPLRLGPVLRRHDLHDRQVEPAREVEVALVVRGDGHDRPGPVLHQHVVGDEHGELGAVHRIGDGPAERHAGLVAVLGTALLGRLPRHPRRVFAHLLLVLGPGGEPVEVRVLGRDDEERGAEQRVGAGREDGEVEVELLAAEDDLGALRAADPVPLHRQHVLGPGVEGGDVVEQPVGVVGDLEEPLLEVPLLDQGAAALAMAVDHLLVGEDGLVDRAPLDGSLRPVGEAALEHAQEDPLRPPVVRRVAGGELARPVDRHAPAPQVAPERVDRGPGGVARMLSGLDRVVLGRQAERVVAHRVDDLEALAPADVGERRRRSSSSSGGRCAARPRGREASRARTPSASTDRSRARPGSGPPRCARRPRPPASGPRSPWGRSGRARPWLRSV